MRVSTDVAVIGAGPGGYVAAVRLAQLGKKVMLADKGGFNGLGGICMNHGCIPSKALILASEFFQKIKKSSDMGINVSSVSLDANKLQDWKEGILKKLRAGVDFLLKKNGVRFVSGNAYFESSNSMKIEGNDEIDSIDFKHAVVATGAVPVALPNIDFDGDGIMSYNEILDLRQLPSELLIVGGGYIAVEMAACYARLGSNVKLVNRSGQILRGYDSDAVKVVQKRMEKDGVEFVFNSTVSKIEKSDNGVEADVVSKDGSIRKLKVDKMMVAIGVKPNSNNLGLENTKVKTDGRGFIMVDKKMRTSDSSIFAIGDVATQPMLAHKASHEGKIVAEVIAGKETEFDNVCVPYVIFGDPEVAVAGLTENEARQKGYDIDVGKFPFSALGRAVVEGNTDGFVKIIEDRSSGRIIGVVIVGSHASSLIGEGALAVEKGMKAEDLIDTIHPHPTMTESLVEAAEVLRNMSVHIVKI